MADVKMKTLDFGTGDRFVLSPEWENVDGVLFGVVVSNTLKWDGDITDKVAVVAEGVTLVHVSDVVPTMKDLKDGVKVTYSDGETYESTNIEEIGSCIVVDSTEMFIVKEDYSKYTGSGIDVVFPKKGIYFPDLRKESGYYVCEAIIKGYTGNGVADLPFGETTVVGDTLTWDGNTDGLYNIMGMFYHVSDEIPTLEMLQNGGSIVYCNTKRTFTGSEVIDLGSVGMGSDFILITAGGIYAGGIALREGATAVLEGMTVTFEKSGVYLLKNSEIDVCISELTINGFTNFTGVKIDKIPAKYISEFVVDIFRNDGAYSTDVTFDEIYKHRNGHLRARILGGTSSQDYFEITSITYEKVTFVSWNFMNDGANAHIMCLTIDNQNNITVTVPKIN